MSCAGTSNCTCGCCSGTSVQTPQLETNTPGLSAISYRAGTWASFKESMLARLSSSDYPALAGLKSRDNDDFTIAFLDATAVMLDILTFYQERLANESYLRTAGQLRSLIELSRLIGYTPAPGVSAFTYLAFTLKTAPGQAPDPSTPAITIPQGSQVQSVPAQGQTPQTFETSAPIQAKPDWNALAVQTGQPWIAPGAGGVYLAGTSTQLKLGDSLLILGVDRETWSSSSTLPSEQWEVVVLNQVEVDNVRNLTYVAWDSTLPHESESPAGNLRKWGSATVFAFRQKAALFGNNAPNPNLFVNQTSGAPSLPNLIDSSWDWINYNIPSKAQIDLDATYSKIVVGSWFALTRRTVTIKHPHHSEKWTAGNENVETFEDTYWAQLFKVTGVHTVSLANFGLSAKVTELVPDYLDPGIPANFPLQSTEVWAQSDELAVAPQPLAYPLYGSVVDLADLRPDLVGVTVVGLVRQPAEARGGRPRHQSFLFSYRRYFSASPQPGRRGDHHRSHSSASESRCGSRLELHHQFAGHRRVAQSVDCRRRERPPWNDPNQRRNRTSLERLYAGPVGKQRSRSERMRAGRFGAPRDRALSAYAAHAEIEPGELL